MSIFDKGLGRGTARFHPFIVSLSSRLIIAWSGVQIPLGPRYLQKFRFLSVRFLRSFPTPQRKEPECTNFRQKWPDRENYIAPLLLTAGRCRTEFGSTPPPCDLVGRSFSRASDLHQLSEALIHRLKSRLPADAELHATELGLAIDEVVTEHARIVNWTANSDVRNHMLNAAEDCMLDAARRKGFALPLSVLDEIGKELLPIAEAHYHDMERGQ